MVHLPERREAAEDAFVRELESVDDINALIDVIVEAMGAGRPLLAARVARLLPDGVGSDLPPAVARAQQAARLLLVAPLDRRGPVIAELEAAVAELRSDMVTRARNRMRQAATDPSDQAQRRRKPRSTRGR